MSIFTDNKSNLEAKGFVVQDDNTVLGANGQPAAGRDAYGQLWFKEEGIEASEESADESKEGGLTNPEDVLTGGEVEEEEKPKRKRGRPRKTEK